MMKLPLFFQHRLIPNAVGLLAFYALAQSPRNTLSSHWEVFFLAAVPFGIWLGLNYFFWFKPNPKKHPPEDRARWWYYLADIGSLLAGLVVITFLATLIPPVRRAIARYDHRLVNGVTSYYGGIGFARRGDLYTSQLGPVLLRDTRVTSRRMQHLNPDEIDLISERAEWSLYFAALRLQGLTTEQIWDLPEGKHLILGTVVAELFPPYWWTEAGWLRQELKTSPQAGFKLGLIDPQFAKIRLAQFFQTPTSNTQEELRALVFLVSRSPDLLSQSQIDLAFKVWAEKSTETANALTDMATNRLKFKQFAAAVGIASEVEYSLKVPDVFPAEVKAEFLQSLSEFLMSCGFHPRPGTQVQFSVTVEKRTYENVPFESYELYEQKIKEEQRVQTSSSYKGVPSYQTKTVERTEYQRKTQTGTAPALDVPTAVFSITYHGQTETLIAAPAGRVETNYSSLFDQYMSGGDLHWVHKLYFEEFVKATVLKPWRLGLERVEDDKKAHFYDEF